jgi:hypothetical protein
MTRNEIDDLMRENGIVVVGEAVYALCQLAAAHEREACAKVCEDSNTWDLYDPNGFAANLIRARGQE